jgi:hypothetical protein
MTEYTVSIDKPEPGPFDDNQGYLQFVDGNACLSYMNQYGAATPEEGLTAAREAYNASLPVEAPVADEPVVDDPAP